VFLETYIFRRPRSYIIRRSRTVKRPRVVYKEIADLDFRAKAGLAWRSEDERPVAKRFPEEVLEACRTYSSERKAVGG